MREKGIVNVERGWQRMREIIRLIYTPAETNIYRIEGILKDSGTYVRTHCSTR